MTRPIDPILEIEETSCPKCGLSKSYHRKDRGEHRILCVRSKPYKLRDGADVVLGMQVWHVHPWEGTIITGMVRFVRRWGELGLWKYLEDRDKNRIFDLAWPGSYSASFSCFSSLANAEAHADKIKRKRNYN